jgi:hypothetical protein
MPFCVSSFSALVKDAGYIVVFPPNWKENLIGCGAILLFLALVTVIRKSGSSGVSSSSSFSSSSSKRSDGVI